MTSILARYVFRQATGALVLILGSLSGMVWIALALRELNVVTSEGQSAATLLAMTTLALPNLTALIAPFALLVATLHTLNRLSADSELIVMTAGGATVWVVARPLLLLGAIVTAAVAFANHVGMPWSLQQLRSYATQVRTDLLAQLIQPGRFSSPEPALTFHIRDRAPNGEILGLLVHDERNRAQPMSYLAERGVITKQDDHAYLIMSNGHVISQDNANSPPRVVTFDKYIFDLDALEQRAVGPIDLKPRERYWSDLVNPSPESALFKRQPGQFRAEIHERLSSPLYPLAFVMIAIATLGRAASTRTNRTTVLVLAIVLAAGARMAGLAVNNLVAINAAFVPVLYAIPLAAIAGSLLALLLARRQRQGAPTLERLADRVGEIGQRISAWLPLPARARRAQGI